MRRRARIIGVGSYHPRNLITNEELSKRIGEPISINFENKVGILQRYITDPDESTADLAYEAAKRALEMANVSPKDIDLIILATDTPEYITPPTSAIVQGRLGAINAGFFDINASCAGFAGSLAVASKMIMADDSLNKVLVIGAYNMSKFIDYNTPGLSAIFADGGGAVVLTSIEENAGFLASKFIGDGTQYGFLGIYDGGAKNPFRKDNPKDQLLTSFKPLPPDRNLKMWPPLVKEVVERAGYKVEDIDHIFFTQINKSVILEVMDTLGLDRSKATTIMEKYGYTGSACLPMALDDAVKNNRIKRGDLIVFVGSGVGFSMAASAFIY
ncbi:MAG TPA: ketoacyl-ACP synthase III [Clostridia bacterium]|nr:ketoacyl-ACP synthase III [Clostridia bacterium]